MKIAPYVDRLRDSQEYKKFLKENKNAFMVAGFFVLDFESGKNMHQIDYYAPDHHKVAAFTLDGRITMQMLSLIRKKIPEKLDLDTKTDLNALRGILEDEMKNRTMAEDIKKIIAVIQCVDNKKIWSVNCILSGMSLLKASIEDESQTILKMDKANIFDFIKTMPAAQYNKLKEEAEKNGGGAAALVNAVQGKEDTQIKEKQPENKEEIIKQELKKLDQLGDAIEKEKTALEGELKKNSKTKKEKAAKVVEN